MSSLSNDELPHVSLGIASGPAPREAHLCVLDHARHSLSTLAVTTSGRPVRQDELDEGRCDALDAASVDAVAEFLADRLPPGTTPAALVEAQQLFPHPDYQDTPAGAFPWGAAPLGLLMTLATQELGVPLALGCYEVPERSAIVVHHIVDDEDAAWRAVRQQPRMLGGGLLRASAGLLLGGDPTPGQSAAVAALLARAPGAYYYWSTFAQPPSLGDVVQYHRSGQRKMLVGGGTERYTVQVRPGPQTDEDISLAYLLAEQAHQGLGANDARKVALVHVCREFGHELRCYSRRADARAVDPRRVWPWPDEDAWALEEARRLRA